ncbi:MAG: hypothetical protein ABIC19_00230 [Patescibacteria group bacterium]|nr:hypothetical protein [Patescibacteria group bacterium]
MRLTCLKRGKYIQGMTLIESLMAVILFTVISLMVASFLIYGYKNHVRVTEEALSTDRVNINIQNMVEELRKMRNGENGAYAIDAANKNEIIFYSDIDSDSLCERVRYFLDGENLFKGIVEGAGQPMAYPLGSEETEKMGREIINDQDNPIFSYWGIDGETGQDIELSYPVDVSDIRLIKVNLKTRINLGQGRERTVESQVFLRNLRN